MEDRFWEQQIGTLLGKLMRAGQDHSIEAALEHLLMSDSGAYEVLVEMCETLSESTTLEKNGQIYDVQLIVAPIAAWTRYSIPVGKIRKASLDALRAQLHGHVLAQDVQLALVPTLLSIEQMPRSFSATHQWLLRLGAQALGIATTQKLVTPPDGEAMNMLADTRYLAGVIAVPQGHALFRWQEAPDDPDAGRAGCLKQWAAQVEPTLAALLPGCGLKILLPDAWYTGNREADRHVRPLSIIAAVNWLEGALNVPAGQLRAVIAGVGDDQVDEYRIGFTLRNRNDVVYGCVWPLFGRESEVLTADANGEFRGPLDEITDLLKAQGVQEIRRLPALMPPEFCEDCGSPYFPDPTGELAHPELPEEADTGPKHFH